MQCPALYINQALSLVISFDSFFKIPVYLLVPLKLSVHGTYFNCIPSQSSISLFSVIGFELPITRTFLYKGKGKATIFYVDNSWQ